MKLFKAKWIVAARLGLLAMQAQAQNAGAPATQPGQTAPSTQKDKVSYGVGVQVARA